MIELYKNEIVAGKQYRHWKNKHVYEVVGEAINADKQDEKSYIIYKDIITNQMFIRSPVNFFGWVKDGFGDKVSRFEPL